MNREVKVCASGNFELGYRNYAGQERVSPFNVSGCQHSYRLDDVRGCAPKDTDEPLEGRTCRILHVPGGISVTVTFLSQRDH